MRSFAFQKSMQIIFTLFWQTRWICCLLQNMLVLTLRVVVYILHFIFTFHMHIQREEQKSLFLYFQGFLDKIHWIQWMNAQEKQLTLSLNWWIELHFVAFKLDIFCLFKLQFKWVSRIYFYIFFWTQNRHGVKQMKQNWCLMFIFTPINVLTPLEYITLSHIVDFHWNSKYAPRCLFFIVGLHHRQMFVWRLQCPPMILTFAAYILIALVSCYNNTCTSVPIRNSEILFRL